MNAKRCKHLRRAAERMSVGRPGRRLVKSPVDGVHRRHFVAINDPTSTRGMYRTMKQTFKAALKELKQ